MVICLGRNSKARLVGTVLSWDKGGIVAGWALLSPTVALLWAFSHCAHRDDLGLSFLKLKIIYVTLLIVQQNYGSLTKFQVFLIHVISIFEFVHRSKMRIFFLSLELIRILFSMCRLLATQFHKLPVSRKWTYQERLHFCKPARRWKFPWLLCSGVHKDLLVYNTIQPKVLTCPWQSEFLLRLLILTIKICFVTVINPDSCYTLVGTQN